MKATTKTAQFTPGPTCTCEIVMRTGETLDSSLGNRPCSDISRILLCPLHTAAPAMYAAGQLSLGVLVQVAAELERTGNEELRSIVRSAIIEQKTALAQAEGR